MYFYSVVVHLLWVPPPPLWGVTGRNWDVVKEGRAGNSLSASETETSGWNKKLSFILRSWYLNHQGRGSLMRSSVKSQSFICPAAVCSRLCGWTPNSPLSLSLRQKPHWALHESTLSLSVSWNLLMFVLVGIWVFLSSCPCWIVVYQMRRWEFCRVFVC